MLHKAMWTFLEQGVRLDNAQQNSMVIAVVLPEQILL